MALSVYLYKDLPDESLVGFYTTKPVVTSNLLTPIQLLDDEVLKILTLWFNSSLNLYQLLLNKDKCRKYHGWLEKDILDTLFILDIRTLTENEKQEILANFEKVRHLDFPSFLNQYLTNFHGRTEIDKTILKIMGYNEQESEELLDSLYDTLLEKLRNF